MNALESAFRGALLEVEDPPAQSRAIDGVAPALQVRARTPAETAAALRLAAEHDAAVVPWGGGTQMGLGMPPERYDLALDLTGLNRVVEYEPADLTVTVEAGIRLADLQQALAERRQWLPLDPPLPLEATIGGILATNASGPARYRHGTARDLVIGMTVALPNGELVKSGGRVVKNVAGYDMAKLHIGALGTLGMIVQVTFKVAPLPARSEAVAVTGPLADVMSINARLHDSGLPLQALVLSNVAGPVWRLLVRFAAGEAAVERALRDLRLLISDFPGLTTSAGTVSELELLRPAVRAEAGGDVVLRASIAPAAAEEVIGLFAARQALTAAYPASCVVYGRWPAAKGILAASVRELRASVEELGGSLVVEAAPPGLKAEAG
ncbi:MAG TPA: FAD-binding oxidoreductase, partial [Dehalococcoidia bacterium]|nr:FAD-binding oxidoreductase [Dehalococcoidia bacterium]